LDVVVDGAGDPAVIEIGGRVLRVSIFSRLDGSLVGLFDDGRVVRSRIFPGPGQTRVRTRGRELVFSLRDPRDAASSAVGPTPASDVIAAMPGRVVEVRVSAGERVAAGRVVLILEAMKMQNEIRAEADGIVEDVRCRPGQAVDAGTVLVRVGPLP
jgi:acetyl/propionyl-CoA carboxylase alpha subunit